MLYCEQHINNLLKTKHAMRQFFSILLFSFLTMTLYGQESNYYLKSAIGYSHSNNNFAGVSTDLGIGYKLKRFLGFELTINNMYQYQYGDIEGGNSDTNTGIALSAHVYPLRLEKHSIDLSVGFAANMNYWTQNGGMGRHFYPVPFYTGGYIYSFNKFDIGIYYRYQHFKFYRNMKNKQVLLSIKKYF